MGDTNRHEETTYEQADNQDRIVGLIPAAGSGTRLGLPYPKELQPLIRGEGYKPAAQFALELILEAGASHVVFVVNDTKHQLMKFFGDGHRFGADLSYVVQEVDDAPKDSQASAGLADALDAAFHLTRDSTVLFAMADTIIRPKAIFASLMEQADRGDDVVLALFRVKRPEKFGMVDLQGDGLVTKIVDKPSQTDLTYAWGCMAWRPLFSSHLHKSVRAGQGDFAAILNDAIEQGMRVRGVVFEQGRFADMGTLDEVLETEEWYRSLPESEI
jgi:glucose-1-phosphate thymidylyltransferase